MSHIERLKADMGIVAKGGQLKGNGVILCKDDKKTKAASKHAIQLMQALLGVTQSDQRRVVPSWQSLPPLP